MLSEAATRRYAGPDAIAYRVGVDLTGFATTVRKLSILLQWYLVPGP